MRCIAPATLILTACAPEARYQRIVDQLEPGAQMTVRSADGELWTGAGGVADVGVDMTDQHRFLVGSTTKMMTATLLLQLVDEGALALQDPASTWVPALDPSITVEDLLRHTSGVGDYFDHPILAAGGEARTGESWAPEELVAFGLEVRDDGPAETGTYANTNYIVAGMILEAVEGRPAQEVFQERLFTPLGMDDSALLTSGTTLPANVAMGNGGAFGVPTRYDASVGWTAGSLVATTPDVMRFLDALVDGELVGPSLHAEQLAPVPCRLQFEEEGVETFYGLGVMIVDAGPSRIIGHFGGVDGFLTASFVDPGSGARVVLAANHSDVDIAGPALKALRIAGR